MQPVFYPWFCLAEKREVPRSCLKAIRIILDKLMSRITTKLRVKLEQKCRMARMCCTLALLTDCWRVHQWHTQCLRGLLKESVNCWEESSRCFGSDNSANTINQSVESGNYPHTWTTDNVDVESQKKPTEKFVSWFIGRLKLAWLDSN